MLEKLNTTTLLLEEDKNPLYSLVASQMNHSTSVEDFNYGRSSLVFNNINSNLQFKYLQFCLRYFDYFKLNNIDLPLDSYRSKLRMLDNLERDSNLNIANSLAVKYTRSSSLIDNTSRKHNRQASSLSSTLSPALKRVKTQDLVSLNNLDPTSTTTLVSILQDFLQDPLASFRSLEQGLLVQAILLKVPYILGVLPTSIGKSLSYLLTSSLSISKVTIVIIPLIGLKSDIVRRAKDFNIPYSIYEDSKEFSNLTLVSIETIISETFIREVRSLINSNNIDRIIIEECHLLITALSYRSIMFRFKELLVLPLQFVFLSGTLPLKLEEELLNTLYLEDISIIRTSCLRTNISYRARPYISSKEEERILEIQDYIEDFKAKEFLTSKDKILIFCPSIANIDKVASILNYNKYYSSLSKEEKESTLNSFFNSTEAYHQVLVTSSALEEGIDYSSIRLVIYKDIAYSFIGFLQGSSRAGRDNLQATSMFFYSSKDIELDSSNTLSLNNIKEDKYLINIYLKEVVCRKRVISSYLDNKIIDSCSSNNTLCDLCFNRSNITSKQVSRILESNKEVERINIEIKEQLDIAFSTCIYCFLLKDFEDTIEEEHNSSSCPLYKDLEEFSLDIKSYIRKRENFLIKDSCCFTCLLPTIICKYYKKSSSCFQSNFMFQVLALLFKKRRILIPSFKTLGPTTLYPFLKEYLRKEYIKELDTEGVYAFKYIVFDS